MQSLALYKSLNFDPSITRTRSTNSDQWQFLIAYQYPDLGTVDAAANMPLAPTRWTGWDESGVERDVHELVEFAFFTYPERQIFRPSWSTVSSTDNLGKSLIMVGLESPAGDEELDEWYKKQHLDMLSMIPGYRMSSRYQLQKPQGLVKHLLETGGLKEPFELPPRWLALHQYEQVGQPDPEWVKKVVSTEWSKKILDGARYERGVWEYVKEFEQTNGGI